MVNGEPHKLQGDANIDTPLEELGANKARSRALPAHISF